MNPTFYLFVSGVNQRNVEERVSPRFSSATTGMESFSLELLEVGWCNFVCGHD